MPRVIRTFADVRVGDQYLSRSTNKVLTVNEICLAADGTVTIRGTRPDKADPSVIVNGRNTSDATSRRWTAVEEDAPVERTNRSEVQIGDYALVNEGSRRRPDGLRVVVGICLKAGGQNAFVWHYPGGEHPDYEAKAKPANDPIEGVFAGPAPEAPAPALEDVRADALAVGDVIDWGEGDTTVVSAIAPSGYRVEFEGGGEEYFDADELVSRRVAQAG